MWLWFFNALISFSIQFTLNQHILYFWHLPAACRSHEVKQEEKQQFVCCCMKTLREVYHQHSLADLFLQNLYHWLWWWSLLLVKMEHVFKSYFNPINLYYLIFNILRWIVSVILPCQMALIISSQHVTKWLPFLDW